jgi:serine/threonine protein kinase
LSRAIDERSDIWSLGAIFYEMLTKKRPFPYGKTGIGEMIRLIVNVDPPPPRQIVPSLLAELERICLKCLAKQPDQRYQTASDLGHDLRRWLAT